MSALSLIARLMAPAAPAQHHQADACTAAPRIFDVTVRAPGQEKIIYPALAIDSATAVTDAIDRFGVAAVTVKAR